MVIGVCPGGLLPGFVPVHSQAGFQAPGWDEGAVIDSGEVSRVCAVSSPWSLLVYQSSQSKAPRG